MNYRPEIDGLRAFAVTSVILYHAGVSSLPGGFTGVDIFFVISGYLITSILSRDLRNNNFSLLQFYQRRARRIFPALFVVIGVSVIVASFLIFPAEFKSFGLSVIAASLSVSNILFWRESGYFATSNDFKPLLHTWSLGVEEQFYLLFPLLLIILWNFRLRKVHIFYALLFIFSAGFLLSDWASTRYIAASYYLLPTRMWEILAGSLVATSHYYLKPQRDAVAQFGSILGLLLLVIGIIFIDETYPWPGRWALLPVVGTVLFIVFANSRTLVGRVFSWRPFVLIGLISYSAYLWHQPLFAFARIASTTGRPSIMVMAFLVVATFGLAWFTWRFVEQPFRNTKLFTGFRIFQLSTFGSLGMFALGGLIWSGDGWPVRFSPDVQNLIATSNESGRGRNGCHPKNLMPKNGCRFDVDGASSRVLLWGDSHAMAISEMLSESLSQSNIVLETLTSSGCPPVLDLSRTDRNCLEVNANAIKYITGQDSPDLIILHAYWSVYAQGSNLIDPSSGQVKATSFKLTNADGKIISTPREYKAVVSRIENTVHFLKSINKKVLVIGSIPEAGLRVPQFMARRLIFNLSTSISGKPTIAEDRAVLTHRIFERLQSQGLISYFDPSSVFCFNDQNTCILHQGLTSLYRDSNHLSLAGAKKVANPIAQLITKLNP